MATFLFFYNLIAFLHTNTKRKHESDLLPTYAPSMCKWNNPMGVGLVGSKVVVHKSRGEVFLVEQDTIECVS